MNMAELCVDGLSTTPLPFKPGIDRVKIIIDVFNNLE